MKQIQAYIKKHKLNEVIRNLRKVQGVTGLSIMGRSGFGRGWASGKSSEHASWSGIKMEVFCNDDVTESIVSVIEQAAHTGLKGDGKIYISCVEQAVRISTGERGESAV